MVPVQRVLANILFAFCLDIEKAAYILLFLSVSIVKMAVVLIQLSFCYWYLLKGKVQYSLTFRGKQDCSRSTEIQSNL